MAVIGYGFIGRRVARAAAERGWRVRALSRAEVSANQDGAREDVDVVRGHAQDVTALERVLEGVHHVVYAAGTAKPAESNFDPVSDAVRNLEPLLAVLSAMPLARHQRVHLPFVRRRHLRSRRAGTDV